MDRPNYITPEGFEKLKAEKDQLWSIERPDVVKTVAWAASNGDRSENADYQYGKKRLREIDRRVRFLTKRIESAKVVDPAQQNNKDKVYFGATVTYVNDEDVEITIRIVGEDEMDSTQGWISWISPVAKALTGKAVGETVLVRTPKGEDELEILKISYEE